MQIKKLLLLMLLPFLFSCSGKSLMQDIPMAEFERFEYHRAANFSSLHIVATGAIMDEDYIVIDHVSLQADYGPFVNFNIKLEGYARERIKDVQNE